MVEIVSINRSQRLALTDNNDICAIDTFLDEHGDEVDNLDLAVVAIGQLPDSRWFMVDMRDFVNVEAN